MMWMWAVSLLSVLCLPTVSCIREGDASYGGHFDTNTNKASGTLRCTQDDERLDIGSIEYSYLAGSASTPCNFSCPSVRGAPGYLDGTNTVCKNENNIRSTCYGRNSCTFTDIQLPNIICGADVATYFTIYYRCVPSDSVFNLCEERSMTVTEQTTIILTSPLSTSDTYYRSTCKCVISSLHTNQPLNQNMSLILLRMHQLLNGDTLSFGYGSPYQYANYTLPYNKGYLRKDFPIPIGIFNSSEASVEIHNTLPLVGNSRFYFTMQPGIDIRVDCNYAASSELTSTSTITTSASTTTAGTPTTTAGTPTTTAGTPTSTTRNDFTASHSTPTLPGGTEVFKLGCERFCASKDVNGSVLVPVTVLATVVAVLCAALVIALCLMKRHYSQVIKRLTADGSKQQQTTAAPDTYELLQQVREEPVYRQIDQTERHYGVVRADNDYSEPDERQTAQTQDDAYLPMKLN